MIIKPKTDNRLYENIILDNNLQVLLISDPETKTSACSLNVNVGYSCDDINYQGTAHFLEHMLFMGTEKYPDEDYYMNFVKNHGGFTNAFTTFDNTNYFFSISNDKFKESLDIFSQFFINPLLKPERIEREINAVNAEHSKNKNSDIWRVSQIINKTCINQDHPMSKFGCGSSKTLNKPGIKDALMKFYNTYYSSDIMYLILYSNMSIDKLKKISIRYFSSVINKNIKNKIIIPDNFLNISMKDKIVKFIPINDHHELYLLYELPPENKDFKYKPFNIITSLLDHEYKGGLYDYLINRGLIYNLNAYIIYPSSIKSLYSICLKLTDTGLDNINLILSYIDAYIINIRDKLTSYYFDEFKKISQIDFDYYDKIEPSDYITNIQSNFGSYDIKYILYANSYYLDYNPDLIKKYLDDLRVDNCIVLLASKKNKLQNYLTEEHFKIKYQIYERDKLDIVDNIFSYPEKNKYIPNIRDLKIINKEDHLEKINISNGVMYYNRTRYDIPYIYLDIILYSKSIQNTITNYLQLHLLTRLFDKVTESMDYYAGLGGSGFNIKLTSDYIILEFRSYPDIIDRLIDEYLEILINIKKNPDSLKYFEFIKEEYQKDLENIKYLELTKMVNLVFNEKVYNNYYSFQECLDNLQYIKYDDLNIPDFYKMKACVYGNITKDKGIKLVNKFNKFIKKYDDNEHYSSIGYNLNPGDEEIHIRKNYNNTEPDSAILISYELKNIRIDKNNNDWIHDLSLSYLIDDIINHNFFDALRTKSQNGYIVRSFIKKINIRDIFSINQSFFIETPNKHPMILRKLIKRFVKSQYIFIQELSDDKFYNYKEGLIYKLTKPFTNIIEEMNYIVGLISSNIYIFDYKEILADYIRKITKKDIIEYYYDNLINKNKKVRIFELYNVEKNLKDI
jgi:insulysin